MEQTMTAVQQLLASILNPGIFCGPRSAVLERAVRMLSNEESSRSTRPGLEQLMNRFVAAPAAGDVTDQSPPSTDQETK